MAFQDVNVSKTKKVTGMNVGESITGYVLRIEESAKHEGQQNLVMQDEATGETFLLFSAGNLRYLLADGKIKTGLLTRIERISDKNVKGKMSTQVLVQQDPENTIATVSAPKNDEDSSFAALGSSAAGTTSNDEPVNIKGAVERNIKKQADKLAASMGARK